jgi:hypothetical protein
MCRAKSLLPLSTNHLSHETIDPPFTNTEPISESAVAAPGNDWLKVLVAPFQVNVNLLHSMTNQPSHLLKAVIVGSPWPERLL